MTPRDTSRRWGTERCAQLGRLDRADGLTCPADDALCAGQCWVRPRRQPLLTADDWLLLACLIVLAVILTAAYTTGQDWRCDRLTAAGDPAAATYCAQDQQ